MRTQIKPVAIEPALKDLHTKPIMYVMSDYLQFLIVLSDIYAVYTIQRPMLYWAVPFCSVCSGVHKKDP